MLKNIFVYLLHNSIGVCVVILTVFAVRLFLRRAPKKYSYILWSIVGIYLLCPIRLSSPISIYSLINNVSDTFLEHHSLPLNAKNFADKNKTYNEKNQKTKDSNKSKFDNVSSTNKNQKTKQNQNNTAGTENCYNNCIYLALWLYCFIGEKSVFDLADKANCFDGD